MASFFKEQIFVLHAISELFPSEITSSNLMQNMSGCHCRDLVKLRGLAGPTNLQKQCSFVQCNASQVHTHGLGIGHQQGGALLIEGETVNDSEAGALLSQAVVGEVRAFPISPSGPADAPLCPRAWAHTAVT